jgi:hypothetical protein
MRGPVWAAPLVFVTACSAGAVRPVAALRPGPPDDPAVTAILGVASAAPASREVVVRFVAAACSVVKRVVVEERADRVVVTLDQAGREGKDCTDPFERHREILLAAPLGHRGLYDGGVAPPALIRAPT